MSRTYIATNPAACGNFGEKGSFDVNSAGCALLAAICKEVGFYRQRKDWIDPPFVAERDECLQAAKRLKALDDVTVARLHSEAAGLFDGSLADFAEFVNEWADFLASCDGYEVLG